MKLFYKYKKKAAVNARHKHRNILQRQLFYARIGGTNKNRFVTFFYCCGSVYAKYHGFCNIIDTRIFFDCIVEHPAASFILRSQKHPDVFMPYLYLKQSFLRRERQFVELRHYTYYKGRYCAGASNSMPHYPYRYSFFRYKCDNRS